MLVRWQFTIIARIQSEILHIVHISRMTRSDVTYSLVYDTFLRFWFLGVVRRSGVVLYIVVERVLLLC